MEFKHLQTFQTIIKTGSFSGAADRLQYAQSTITLHIQQLESELGVKLFARRGQKIEVTKAGETLSAHASFLLHRAEILQREMTELVIGETGHLRIGAIEPVASLKLPSLLASFCHKYPHIRLTLETGVTKVISERVTTGKLDLAICSPPDVSLGLSFSRLFNDSMALLIPSRNYLSNKAIVEVIDLEKERLLVTETNCPYRQVFEKEVFTRGVNPDLGIEIMSLQVLQGMVQSGLGIGVMPIGVITPPPENTVVRNLHEVNLELPVGIATSSTDRIPGLAFDVLLQALKNGLRA
ncbi:MAG: LysR family transcriptional regulator [Cyanobacteria bacterium J06600_6]